MNPATGTVTVRSLTELDLGGITSIDERLTGTYKPEIWERRVVYYLRRDPDGCPVAEVDGRVVGFMFTDLRGGEFGLEETSGWIERRGAVVLRTLVGPGDDDLAGFLRAVGFRTAPLQALERPVNDAGAPR
jgi:hypothetical protein